jgi:FolB domain-containing protein
MDKILIRGLKAHGILGVHDWERHTPREIIIDLELYSDTRLAGVSDRVEDSVDYSMLSRLVQKLAESAQRQTVEALAEDVARLCLAQSGVQGARVRVEKPGAVSFVETVGVEIERWQGEKI